MKFDDSRFKSCHDNVIHLLQFKTKKSLLEKRDILYLTSNGRWKEILSSFSPLNIRCITGRNELKESTQEETPSMIFLESNLHWADPIKLITELNQMHQIPVVMICDGKKNNQKLMKNAYSVGCFDTLFEPLERDEVFETIEVILKINTHLRQHH